MKDLLHFEYLRVLALSILLWSVFPIHALNIYDYCEKGFWYQKNLEIQMDTTPEKESILLYGRDVGHYPEFDLFEYYYVIYRDDYLLYTYWNVYKLPFSRLVIRDVNEDGFSELITYEKSDSLVYSFKHGQLYNVSNIIHAKTELCSNAEKRIKTNTD